MDSVAPLYLFADSQMLFWNRGSRPFLESVLDRIVDSRPRAAYVGASNSDRPEYFEIFRAAMAGIGIDRCRMIRSEFAAEDRDFVSGAALVLLAGGDPGRGWRVFEATGMKDAIAERYRAGAVLVGISAGAVQLGLRPPRTAHAGLTGTFQFVPCLIGAHEEDTGWSSLKASLRAGAGFGRALGIPSGAGVIYHTDHTIEPLRKPVTELLFRDGKLESSLLVPEHGHGADVRVH